MTSVVCLMVTHYIVTNYCRIVQGVEERRKLKDVQEKRRNESNDSMAIFRLGLI